MIWAFLCCCSEGSMQQHPGLRDWSMPSCLILSMTLIPSAPLGLLSVPVSGYCSRFTRSLCPNVLI